MTKDILKLAEHYHDALNRFDFDAIEKMFAEDAEYHSSGIGGVYGRSNIMDAMRAYFHEFSDQVSSDERLEILSETSVRSHWRLSATTKSSGRKVTRQGLETLHFNAKGLIVVVEVQDVEAVRE
jgi:ketosteroid isomerase-like protein